MNEGGDNFSTKRSMKKAPPHGNPSKRASGSARAGPRSDSPGREIDYSSPKGSGKEGAQIFCIAHCGV